MKQCCGAVRFSHSHTAPGPASQDAAYCYTARAPAQAPSRAQAQAQDSTICSLRKVPVPSLTFFMFTLYPVSIPLQFRLKRYRYIFIHPINKSIELEPPIFSAPAKGGGYGTITLTDTICSGEWSR